MTVRQETLRRSKSRSMHARRHVPTAVWSQDATRVTIMRVLIAGGSGLIGRHWLAPCWRRPSAGHPVAECRPSAAIPRCGRSRSSRAIPPRRGDGKKRSTAATRSSTWPVTTSSPTAGTRRSSARFATAASTAPSKLVAAIKQAQLRPKVFVQGSAIGYYGPHGDEEIDRVEPVGHRFPGGRLPGMRGGLAARSSARACAGRSSGPGSCWHRGEGALQIMTPIFKLGPGVPIGSGGGLVGQGRAVDELDPHRRHRRASSGWPSRTPGLPAP